MKVRVRGWRLVLIVTGLIGVGVDAQPRADGIVPHRATYALFEGDKRVGESVFTLSYDSRLQQYTFESQSSFRGWLRLAVPRPVVERSEFVIEDGIVRPLAFAYEDGSRRGRRNIALNFDWDARTMTVERQEDSGELSLEPATLDRGSVRVALMRDVAIGQHAGTHVLADPDVIRAYDYIVESTEEIKTAIGAVNAHRVRQQRDDSSRHTLIWIAPGSNFAIVRMEQHRDGRDTVRFEIESIEWLADGGSP